jgi:hypothetical protein
VTDSTIQPLRASAAALSLVIAASSATAWADPGASANIPNRASNSGPNPEKDRAFAPAELPLPYEPWQGRGFRPPRVLPATELPPPLARPRQLARRPFELSAALSAFLPNCGSGSIDDRACLTLAPGSGVDGALLYRVGPYFAVGAEGAWSGFGARGHGALSSAGGGGRFFGVAGRVYFADDGVWDPYVALTLGGGSLKLDGAAAGATGEAGPASIATSGFGGRVAGGVDYVFGSHFRLGPSVSFARWVTWGERRCSGGVCSESRAEYGRVLGFASLGFRATASFGDVL